MEAAAGAKRSKRSDPMRARVRARMRTREGPGCWVSVAAKWPAILTRGPLHVGRAV